MNAIRVHEFGGPEVMKLESVPDPTPGPGQVLVGVRAAGVNPVDLYIRSGIYPVKPSLPYTPGSDAAGDIKDVGPGVTSFKPGDRVYVAAPDAGTYAESVVTAASRVYPLPAAASYGQGAALGVPYAAAYRALFQRGNARPGETVLVHGATGGVGIATIELAHARGLTVIGSGGTDRGLALIRDHGADFLVNHGAPTHTEDVMRATSGRGVDLIVETLANVNLDGDLSMLSKHGRVVVVGSHDRVEIDPRMAMSREAAILGMSLSDATESDLVEIHAALIAGLETYVLKPVVRLELPLAHAARAHRALMEPGALGKTVLLP